MAFSVLFLLSTTFILLQCDAQQPTKPNILIWMTDDVGYANFSFGGGAQSTFRLARMGRKGISYTKAWSNPICRPTRATLMTGHYATKTGWWGQFYPPTTSLGAEYGTFAHVAKSQGYRTLMVGKWQLTDDSVAGHGFDNYCLWEKSDIRPLYPLRADFVKYANGPVFDKEERGGTGAGEQNRYWHPLVVRHMWPLEHQMLITNSSDFGPNVFVQCIHDFIKVNKTQPFFIYFAGITAHQHWDDVIKDQAFIGMPKVKGRLIMDINGREAEGTGSFASNIVYIDKMAGYMKKIIRDEGLVKNTIFFFTSDNGSHGFGKGSLISERGTHVPAIVWGGPIKKRGNVDHLFSLIDIYNTVSDLMGAGVDSSRPNSYSWAKFWTGKSDATVRKWMVAHRGEKDDGGVIRPGWVARNDRFIRDGDNVLWDCSGGRDERDCTKAKPSDFSYAYDTLKEKVDEIKKSGFSDAGVF